MTATTTPPETARPRRTRRWIALGVVLALIAGIALYLTQPWTALISRTVDEAAPVMVDDPQASVREGAFTSIEHETSGTARLITGPDGAAVLRLENFDTTNGPDVKVWLSAQPAADAPSARDAEYVVLGDLKGNRGNQNYPIPAGTDLAAIQSVVIWCDRFSVAFGAAPLSAPVEGTAAGAVDLDVTPAAVTAPAAKKGTVITTRSVGSFGRILVDGRGMPLYMFTSDSAAKSRCYGACAKAWPVTVAKGSVRAGGKAKAAKLGSITRKDGRTQVTYAGHPLYFYVDDRPGVALCHDVVEFGGTWLLLKGNGKPVA